MSHKKPYTLINFVFLTKIKHILSEARTKHKINISCFVLDKNCQIAIKNSIFKEEKNNTNLKAQNPLINTQIFISKEKLSRERQRS
jgi:hypothetical protein